MNRRAGSLFRSQLLAILKGRLEGEVANLGFLRDHVQKVIERKDCVQVTYRFEINQEPILLLIDFPLKYPSESPKFSFPDYANGDEVLVQLSRFCIQNRGATLLHGIANIVDSYASHASRVCGIQMSRCRQFTRDFSRMIDQQAVASDLKIETLGSSISLHQAMLWARTLPAQRGKNDQVQLFGDTTIDRDDKSVLVCSTLTDDGDLAMRFAEYVYTNSMKDHGDEQLRDLLRSVGIPVTSIDESPIDMSTGRDVVDFPSHVAQLLHTSFFSDVDIYVGEEAVPSIAPSAVVLETPQCKRFRLHQFVLAARSTYFFALFKSGMSEAKSGQLFYPDIDIDAFECMMHYLYCDELDDELVADCAVQVLILASRFGVDRLVTACEDLIITNLTVDVAVSLWQLALIHDRKAFATKVELFAADNWEKITKDPDYRALTKKEKALLRQNNSYRI